VDYQFLADFSFHTFAEAQISGWFGLHKSADYQFLADLSFHTFAKTQIFG